MKIISSGDIYEIRGDGLKTYDKLPAQVYSVRFSPMAGFYLERHANIEINEPKIYGPHNEKVEKILKSYKIFSRNLGVLLSGDKGMGKSMLAKLLAKRTIEIGMPLIIVDKNYGGIANYIEKIEQEVVVLFDEFDKIFSDERDGDGSSQNELLSLFDGLSSGKKLFVITCNSLNNLSEYLVNRPGRFHYHIRFDYPEPAEVREYLEDNLISERKGEINKIVSFSQRTNLNYDCLRSIVFELNNSEQTFEAAIKDLNILNTSNLSYNIKALFQSGKIVESKGSLNLFSFGKETIHFYDDRNDYLGYATFEPARGEYDMNNEKIIIAASECTFTFDEDADDDMKNEQLKCLIIERNRTDRLRFAL